MSYVRFYLFWILANPIGFMVGSYLGATNDGLIPNAIAGYPGLILGDLTFGVAFGLAQWLVFRMTKFMKISAWWITLTSLGFMVGARSGAILTYRLIGLFDGLNPSFVFGVVMGGSLGLATLLAFHSVIAWKYVPSWLIISALAWVLGEHIAFNSNFIQDTVPWVALAISGITGLELMRHRYFASAQKKGLDNRIISPIE